MADAVLSDNSYWDWVSVTDSKITPDDKRVKDEFKEIMKDIFPDMKSEVDKLFWVDSLVLYLNTYCGVSQQNISKLLNISQFAVSKRYRSSKQKLSFVLNRPLSSRSSQLDFAEKFLPVDLIEVFILYYNIGMISLCSTIYSSNRITFSNKLDKVMSILNAYSRCKNIDELKKYAKFFSFKELEDDRDFDVILHNINSVYNYMRDLEQSSLFNGVYFFKSSQMNKDRNLYETKDLIFD